MARQSNLVAAGTLAALSCLLLVLAVPQLSVAWLTAPLNLDHTQPFVLGGDARDKYTSAYAILPLAQIDYALADAELRKPNLTTVEREDAIQRLEQAAQHSPGNTHIWYLLAAALESELFNAERRALWDHAMSMSLLTGPFARDLVPLRTQQITRDWDLASLALKNLWQEQIISFWGSAPHDLYQLYQSLPPASQQILVDTLGEVPEDAPNE